MEKLLHPRMSSTGMANRRGCAPLSDLLENVRSLTFKSLICEGLLGHLLNTTVLPNHLRLRIEVNVCYGG